jgi:adenylate cyclase
MRDPPLILAVDDTPENLDILQVRLEANGYRVITASDGEEGMARIRQDRPDLVLLDIMMPRRDGISVVREVKADPELRGIPVVMVTAKATVSDVVAGLDAGGDDYLTKPFEHAALLARVRSMLRSKALHDRVQDQAAELERRAAEIEAWNRELENRVAAQVAEIERVSRLKRFLPPQVAEVVLASADGEHLLESHRREVTVVFCDLRGFTAFAESAEPEEVMAVLRDYHETVGRLIHAHEGTLERFIGDGLMVLFNAPLACDDHPRRAVAMAAEMRAALAGRVDQWRRSGFELGFGIGAALGYATLGRIGFGNRIDYAAIGSVPNLASRLCALAENGQILVSQRVAAAVDPHFPSNLLGSREIKGFARAVPIFEIS